MRLMYHRKIGTRLGVGFAIVVGLTILLGVIALMEMNSLAGLIRDLYNHPLVVSNAIRDIRGNILAMQRSMRDFILTATDIQRQEAISQVDKEEQKALQAFDTLYSRFLGDKAEVDVAHQAFIDWRPVRSEEIDLIQSGRKDQAAQIAESKGAEQVLRINEHLQVISDFAKQKATTLFYSAQKTERQHLWTMSAMVLFISAAGILGGRIITRSITRPLGYVVEQIGKVAGGDLNHKINLNSDDEIGVLARTFDDMTASLKRITASRNELDTANQQLEASNQQLQAYHQQMNAANQQLRASEQYRESIISTVPGVVYRLQMDADGDFCIPYISPQAESIIGHPQNILTNSDCFFDIIHSEDVEGFWRSVQDSSRTLEPCTVEFRVFDTNGRLKWLKSISTPQRLADNSTIWNGIIVDITDHKQDEARLLESEERYRIVTDNTYDWEFWLDPNERYVYISPSCQRITGYTVEEFKTDPDLLRAIIHPDDRQGYKIHSIDAMTNKSVGNIEFRIINKDGQIHWIEHFCQPIFDKEGKWLGTRGSNRDATKRKHAEEAMRQSEAFIKIVMDNLPIGIAVNSVNPDVKFSYMNDNFPKFYRTTRGALASPDSFWDAVYEDPNFRKEIKNRVLGDCASGDPKRMIWQDVPITRKGNETTFITAMNTPLSDKQLAISTVWDVTDRKQMEEALRESEGQFRSLFDTMSEGVALHELITDKDGKAIDYRIVDVNPAYEKHTGLTAAQVRNQLASVLYCAGTPTYLDVYAQVAQSGKPLFFETSFPPLKKYFDISVFSPRPGWFATIFMDITQRKRVEQELRRNEEKFMKTFRNNPTIMVISTIKEGRLVEVNDMFVETLGYERQEVIGKTSLELNLYAESEQRHVIVQSVKDHGDVRNMECMIRDRRGQLHCGLISAEIIEFQDAVYLLTIMNDITDRKKAEELQQLHQANMAHLLRLGEVGEMTSGLAHEINQPLCAIENYAQACLRLMETNPNSTCLGDAIKDIRAQAERAGKIVHRIKGLVRKKPPHFEHVEIKDIIREAVELINAEAAKREIQIYVNVPDNLALVYADFILVEQVVLNLIRNGLEAMDSPQINKKELTIWAQAGLNSTTEVSISDTGCGISDENMKKIFESFFTTKPDGLGIGLPLSRAIIESHTGRIWATANAEGGTTFHFTLSTRSQPDET